MQFQMTNKIIGGWLLSLVSLLFFAIPVFAQAPVYAPPGIEEQLTVTITPQIPGPNEQVSIFIESFSANLNKSYIVWSVNGVTKAQGAGVTKFNFENGSLGTVTRVKVTVDTDDGRSLEKTFTFEPASINLVYEALTYTPPFYKGKALFTRQSSLKVVALPEFILPGGRKIDPKNLVYTWKKDGKVLQELSGFGQQSVIIETPIITRPMYISAEVSAVGSNLKAEQMIYVEPIEPEIHLYEENLLYGIDWNREIGGRYFMGGRNEIRLIAEPYFFSASFAGAPDMSYIWRINNEQAPIPPNQNFIGLRNESGDSGSSNIGVLVENKSKILQAGETRMNLDFSKPE